jgi:hypothetical protein
MKQVETMLAAITKRKERDIVFQAKIHGATINLPTSTVFDEKTNKALDAHMDKIMSKGKHGIGK